MGTDEFIRDHAVMASAPSTHALSSIHPRKIPRNTHPPQAAFYNYASMRLALCCFCCCSVELSRVSLLAILRADRA